MRKVICCGRTGFHQLSQFKSFELLTGPATNGKEMELKTPPRNRNVEQFKKPILIPPSPMMVKLGYGSGVAVYKMNRSPIQNKTRSPWALKKVIRKNKNKSTEYDERIREEAAVLRKLKHPNIVGYRGCIRMQDGSTCLAMEACETSLGDIIEGRDEEFTARQVKAMMRDMARALDYLHNEALILHCDVKSYNVLVEDDFEICKLCDFGVCLPLDKDGIVDFEKAGADVEYVGTVLWCPPEVKRLDQVITAKADIYSFGLTIWEMLALSVPVLADDSLVEGEEIKTESRPDLPERNFGSDFDAILEIFYCCTEDDFHKRPTAQGLCVIVFDFK